MLATLLLLIKISTDAIQILSDASISIVTVSYTKNANAAQNLAGIGSALESFAEQTVNNTVGVATLLQRSLLLSQLA